MGTWDLNDDANSEILVRRLNRENGKLRDDIRILTTALLQIIADSQCIYERTHYADIAKKALKELG